MNTSERKYLPHILILAVVGLGAFMDGLDGAIVNVALPYIAGNFHAEMGVASLVITVYLVALSGLMIIFGKVLSIAGIKKIYIAGIAIFTVASLLCALSWDITSLIIFRLIQGTGAAMIAPSAVATVAVHMPESERAKSLGIVAAASALAFAIGPVLGGLLTEFFSWHWIFLINLPIGVITILSASRILPGDIPHTNGKSGLDYAGAAVFFAAMAFLVIPLSFAGDKTMNWSSVGAFLAVSIILFALFVFIEKRTKDPLLKMHMFSDRNFSFATLAYTLFMAAYGGLLLLLPFYFEGVLKLSAAGAGMLLLVPSVVITITSPAGGYFADKYGAMKICSASSAIFLLSMVMISLFGIETTLPYILISLIIMGIGGGPFMSSGSSRIIEHADEENREIASGVMSTAIYFGSALGTALFTAISTFSSRAGEGENIQASGFLEGFEPAMYFGIVCCIIVLVLSIMVKDRKQSH
ncbi:MFS transporter [Methanolacinia petrolearia]|uniref:MFS transporter n=1 Tax=Methanolacinia petrolearia TaxID=54120 RepID=UPI003BA8587C